MQLKKPNQNQISIFTFSIGVFLLNIFQGSKISFDSSACYPISLETGFLILSIITIIILYSIKRTKTIKKIILPVLLASISIFLLEPYIYDYQLNCTNKNLEITCNAIVEFKSKNGRLPNTLVEIEETKNFNTGFKFFDDDFLYQKEDDENFKIQYEVKYGYTCEAWNCSTHFSNMKYTCVSCGAVHNEFLNLKK